MNKPTCDCEQSGPLHLPTCSVIVWQSMGNCDRARQRAIALLSTEAPRVGDDTPFRVCGKRYANQQTCHRVRGHVGFCGE